MKTVNEQIEEQMNFLESMGFDVTRGLSDVEVGGFRFDLTAMRMDKENVLSYVLARAFNAGQAEGQRILKQKFNELLN